MSIYYVASWSVNQNDTSACEEALAAIGEHISAEHPSIRSVRTFRQAWGPAPRRAYAWYEEYESLTAMEADPGTPRCEEIWSPVHGLAGAGTFSAAIWTDPQRGLWFER
jgi:hypothetical protein